MKVIILTNDGLTIAPDSSRATSLRCLTIIDGTVKEDILQPISSDSDEINPFSILPDMLIKGSGKIETENQLSQNFVITTAYSKDAELKLKNDNFRLFASNETNIVNAILIFLKSMRNQESDYCCAP
jgi:hypothetical protein